MRRWTFFGMAAALAVGLMGAPAPAQAELRVLAAPSGPLIASAPTLSPAGASGATFTLRLSEPADSQIFQLKAPARLVIDLPELEWRLNSKQAGPSLDFDAVDGVSGLRVGLFRPGRSRLVLDLAAPPASLSHRVAALPGGDAALVVDIRFGAVAATPTPQKAAASAPATVNRLAPSRAPAPRPRPKPLVVVLDPGHGGRDPGAVAPGLREKDVVLSVARLLRRELERDPRIRVVMTRDRDVFVPLEGRVAIARAARADLFLSIHADSLPQHPEVAGASVYTLSDRASDRMAAFLARRANGEDVDALAGIADAPRDSGIRGIVVDYKRRMVMDESRRFADTTLAAMRGQIKVLRSRPHRYAGFKVLNNFNAPSALVELGFMTNLTDRRRLRNPAWQETAAAALADGVRAWANRTPADMRMASAR